MKKTKNILYTIKSYYNLLNQKGIIVFFLLLTFNSFGSDSFEFYHDNDLFITDEYYTSGIELKYRHMSTLDNENYYNFFFGQKFYTPSDITGGSEEKYNRPYAAWLYFGYEKEKIKINSIKKYGFQLGLTGPNALGEIVQNGIHQIIGEENADGWDEQIEEIWGIQYYNSSIKEQYNKKEDKAIVSLSNHLEYELGNVFTNIKYGKIFLMGNSSLYEEGENEWNYYFYYEPQLQLTVYDATLKGSLYSESSPITKDFNVVMLKNIIGASVTHKNITVNYSLNFNSTEIDDMPWKFVNHIYNRLYFKYNL